MRRIAWIGWLLAASLLTVLLTGQIAQWLLAGSTDEKNCLEFGEGERVTVFIIDQSDPFELADRNSVLFLTELWLKQASEHDRVKVVAPRPESVFSPTTYFNECAPRNPAKLNRVWETPSRLEGPWRDFRNRLMERIETELEREESKVTPLVETIVAVSREPDFVTSRERSIIIISDLMQNSEVVSFYTQAAGEWGPFFDSGILGEVTLRGTKVVVHVAARRKKTSFEVREEVKEFWLSWFRRHGAEVELY